ncbi:MAG: hypothetical protein M1814_005964 [Vezdaea aestivalis]|nr:MAG: hypothetical protein M1814_005964 [Vezdaea aestivalis]
MADPIDRVFSHALNTVKRIPRTGSARPPSADRLRLYGLYKQSMEGDVLGIMQRPSGLGEDYRAEREKWDAWNSQNGLSRTEAKRRYISTLIETMHKYASQTTEAQELVSELEFVWDQIKSNLPSVSPTSSPDQTLERQDTSGVFSAQQQDLTRGQSPTSRGDVGSARDKLETARDIQLIEGEDHQNAQNRKDELRSRRWRQKVETALVKMTVEVSALREQIEIRSWHQMKRSGFGRLVVSFLWTLAQHVLVDFALYTILVLWMRKRKDDRVELAGQALFTALKEKFWRKRARRR